jgi:hypothetical protein
MTSRPRKGVAASVRKADLDARQVLDQKLAEQSWSPDRLAQEAAS